MNAKLAAALTTLTLANIRKAVAGHASADKLAELAKTVRGYARKEDGEEFVAMNTSDFAALAGSELVAKLLAM
jgi:hypothetical protein